MTCCNSTAETQHSIINQLFALLVCPINIILFPAVACLITQPSDSDYVIFVDFTPPHRRLRLMESVSLLHSSFNTSCTYDRHLVSKLCQSIITTVVNFTTVTDGWGLNDGTRVQVCSCFGACEGHAQKQLRTLQHLCVVQQ